jgi:hypothetical protein
MPFVRLFIRNQRPSAVSVVRSDPDDDRSEDGRASALVRRTDRRCDPNEFDCEVALAGLRQTDEQAFGP